MTLQLEHHATKGHATQLHQNSAAPALMELVRMRERRLKLPISPQAGSCQNSNWTLRTSIGRFQNLCGLKVSGFGTLLNQTAPSHHDWVKSDPAVEPSPSELRKTASAKTHLSHYKTGEVVGQSSKVVELVGRLESKFLLINPQNDQLGPWTHLKSLDFTYHSTILNRINTHSDRLGSIIVYMEFLMMMNFNWNINTNRTLTPDPGGMEKDHGFGMLWATPS